MLLGNGKSLTHALLSLTPLSPRTHQVEGCLAANLFDWGSRSCVELYHNGTILDMYRAAKQDLGKRPWAVDRFDTFAAKLLGGGGHRFGGEGGRDSGEGGGL